MKNPSTLIKLLCAHWSETSAGTRLVHELRVLKTAGAQVVDAYLCTLEWQDSPSARLARMTGSGLALLVLSAHFVGVFRYHDPPPAR